MNIMVRTCIPQAARTHLTGNTLNHSLLLALRIVHPSTPAELRLEVPAIRIRSIRLLEVRMKGASMVECARGAVTPEVALGEEL